MSAYGVCLQQLVKEEGYRKEHAGRAFNVALHRKARYHPIKQEIQIDNITRMGAAFRGAARAVTRVKQWGHIVTRAGNGKLDTF